MLSGLETSELSRISAVADWAILKFLSSRVDDFALPATTMVCMELNVKSDAELVVETRAGDREAFGELYDRHARMVRAVVATVSGDWSAVDDMAQESFLRAYRKLTTLRAPDRFAAWISGVAHRVARERRRTLRRDRHEFGARTAELASSTESAPTNCNRDEIERVMRRLAELPEDERLAIHAFYFEGKNANQAAGRLKLSRSGFYALLQRALARLATRPNRTTIEMRSNE